MPTLARYAGAAPGRSLDFQKDKFLDKGDSCRVKVDFWTDNEINFSFGFKMTFWVKIDLWIEIDFWV